MKKNNYKNILKQFLTKDFPKAVIFKDSEVIGKLLTKSQDAVYKLFEEYCTQHQVDCPLVPEQMVLYYDHESPEDMILYMIELGGAGQYEKIYILLKNDKYQCVTDTYYCFILNKEWQHYCARVDRSCRMHINKSAIEYEAFEIDYVMYACTGKWPEE